MSPAIVPVVLSGGAGTRLWPLSTEQCPKQFLRIWDEGRSLFQDTVLRLSGDGFPPPVVICNIAQEGLVREDARAIGVPLGTLLREPLRRDSAAAVAAASAWVEAAYGPEAVVAVFASDHRIPDAAAFRAAVKRAAAVAAEGYIVTFGIRPAHAAIEFGYIERGEPLAGHGDAFRVLRFHEKPDLETATRYLASDRYDWNSGMFVFMAGTFAEEAGRHMPDIRETVREAIARGRRRPGAVELDEAAFARVRKTSIDYALLEKSDRVAVLPVSFEWSDVGNWAAVRKALGPDTDGNVIRGEVALSEAGGNLVMTERVPVRVIGVDDVAVVASPDGVLVVRLDQAARVGRV